ncbi:DUF2059 domain-containing protein [Paracoccus spongiarum]|uniref:DUF2059 domain-containing protein n=1 Tax=Paracoccus spongiarum TaxID=3064387 RepID=A0ABT9JDI5_9RHOB|nr:DUF2059 domain-containing protein [Paracoccus sp. 2205BS29-5]MDP5307898.1 DUF2059 domain-containing protein [Paracoccus sp. 2205BS29-5]
MFRTSCLALFLGLLVLCAGPGPAQEPPLSAPVPKAGPKAGQVDLRLWRVRRLAELMPILRDEALAEARTMLDTLRDGGAGIGWLDSVARIHEPARLEALFRAALRRPAAGVPEARLQAALDFYETDLGRRLVGLETTARRAMLDPDAEALAREAFATAASRNDPRVGRIGRLIEEADLIGPNVAGGLNAAVAFSRGFSDGGGFDMPMTEDQMLADAWSQEAEIRAATLGWMEAYLMLAYSPLSDAELDRYIGFAGSPEGQALSALLFEGFDAIFLQTSRDLGLAAAAQMQGSEL